MTGPRYDLVPPLGGTTVPPPKPVQPQSKPEQCSDWEVSHDPDYWRWDKVLYALAIALITGWLVARALIAST